MWDWLDPYDTLARPLAPEGPDTPDAGVRWAGVTAFAWVWYLSAFPRPLSPRAVATALAVYLVGVLAATLVAGRSWLRHGEVFRVFCGWVGHLPRGRLVRWAPPRHSPLVLGVLAGGLLFRRAAHLTTVGRPQRRAPGSTAVAARPRLVRRPRVDAAGRGRARSAALRAPGAAVAAAVPLTATVAVALALTSSRLLTSRQLLPRLLAEPFGAGSAAVEVDPNPLGPVGLLATQLGVLLAGGVAGSVVAARRAPSRRAAAPAVAAVCAVVAVAVLLVAGT